MVVLYGHSDNVSLMKRSGRLPWVAEKVSYISRRKYFTFVGAAAFSGPGSWSAMRPRSTAISESVAADWLAAIVESSDDAIVKDA